MDANTVLGSRPCRRSCAAFRGAGEEHPIGALTFRRAGLGVVTLFLVSIVVFVATEVLPGNVAYAVLGKTATPQRLRPSRSSFI